MVLYKHTQVGIISRLPDLGTVCSLEEKGSPGQTNETLGFSSYCLGFAVRVKGGVPLQLETLLRQESLGPFATLCAPGELPEHVVIHVVACELLHNSFGWKTGTEGKGNLIFTFWKFVSLNIACHTS